MNAVHFLTYCFGIMPDLITFNSFQIDVFKHVQNDPVPQGPGPEVIKLFSYSTQLSMEFFQLINVKMPTIVGILTFMSGKNSIVDLSEPEKC